MIYDTNNRAYKLLGCDKSYTYMREIKTGDRVKVANGLFSACGFRYV